MKEMRNKEKRKTPRMASQNDPENPVPPKTTILPLEIKGKNAVLSETGPQPKGD